MMFDALKRPGRLNLLWCKLLWAMAAFWLFTAIYYARLPPLRMLFFGPKWLWTGGAVLLILGYVARTAPRQLGLALVALAYAGTLVYNFLGPRNGWLSSFSQHERYGHIGTPNACDFHWSHPEFNVTYSFDAAGWRRTPPPQEPVRGTIVFLGCSYTFGVGVEDDETFVSILARDYWPHYRLLNHAFPGWATCEALVVLEDELKQTETPAAVVYCWIDNHEKRNWLRQSWHKHKLVWGGKMLRWDLENGQLKYLGLTDPAIATAPDTPETVVREEEISLALCTRMDELCRQRNVPFYFVAMNQWYMGVARTPDRLPSLGIPVIDGRDMRNDFFPKDTHPKPIWHRDMAELIAADPRLETFRER